MSGFTLFTCFQLACWVCKLMCDTCKLFYANWHVCSSHLFTREMFDFLLLRQTVYAASYCLVLSFFLFSLLLSSFFLTFFAFLLFSLTLHWGQTKDCIGMLHGTEDLSTIWFRRPLGSISTWPAHCLGSFCGCQSRPLTWITMLNQWYSGISPKASKR